VHAPTTLADVSHQSSVSFGIDCVVCLFDFASVFEVVRAFSSPKFSAECPGRISSVTLKLQLWICQEPNSSLSGTDGFVGTITEGW